LLASSVPDEADGRGSHSEVFAAPISHVRFVNPSRHTPRKPITLSTYIGSSADRSFPLPPLVR